MSWDSFAFIRQTVLVIGDLDLSDLAMFMSLWTINGLTSVGMELETLFI